MNATVQTLAGEARDWYETRPDPEDGGQPQRRDGAVCYFAKDGRPDWVQDLAHHAHGDMLPDDWRYEFIVAALDFLAEADAEDDVDTLRDRWRDECEADVYTSERLQWLASRLDRAAYCDDACREYGIDADLELLDRIALGQVAEKTEVFELVVGWLDERAAELNEDADAESEDADA